MGTRQANSGKTWQRTLNSLTMVADSPEVEQVILGSAEVIEGAKPGSVVVDMSSISPIVTQRIAAELAKRNVAMLDAPVSGGEGGAIQATLSIMVSGNETAFNEVKPVLEKMGKSGVRVGAVGAGVSPSSRTRSLSLPRCKPFRRPW